MSVTKRPYFRRLLLGTSIVAFATAPELDAVAAAPSVNPVQQVWQSLSQQSPSLRQATVSAYAYDVTSHQVLAVIHPDWLQTPASVTKLITTAAALDLLGPGFRYQTRVVTPTHSTGGPIYLVGGGDPLLEADGSTVFETLAAKVAHKVASASRVVGVAAGFRPPLYGIGWTLDDLAADYGAGTSALMAGRSEVAVMARGLAVGRPVQLQLQFNSPTQPNQYFQLRNLSVTTSGNVPETLSVTRPPGTNQVLVTGTLPVGWTTKSMLSIGQPARFAATLFQTLLKHDGVALSSAAATGSVQGPTRLLAHYQSPPLADLLKLQNQYSINQMAENLYRMLGRRESDSGSLAASARVLARWLPRAGVATSGLQMVDGSGLSPLDDMSARQVVQVLRYATTRPWFSIYEHSLMELNSSVNGGVLTGHHFDLPSGTQVWLKTGNLSNQWNYAGYVHTQNGHLVAFAILDNGPPTNVNAVVGSPLDKMVIALTQGNSQGLSAKSVDMGAASGTMDLPRSLAFLVPKLAAMRRASGGIVGLSVVDVGTGRVVWHQNGEKLLPAGLLPRLAVLTAGLERSNGRFSDVTVRAYGTLRAGVLRGWLSISGHGNPLLTPSDLAQLAVSVKRAGIRAVTGSTRLVGERLDMPWPSAMPWSGMGQWYAVPTANLLVNADAVSIGIVGGQSPRQPELSIAPADLHLTVDNALSVNPTAPTTVRAAFNPTTGGYQLTGNVRPGDHTQIQVAPAFADLVGGTYFRTELTRAGVVTPRTFVQTAIDAGRIVGRLPGEQIAALTAPALTQPGNAIVNQVYAHLGSQANTELAQLLGQASQMEDPTAVGMENYLTPDSVGLLLATVDHRPATTPLRQFLLNQLWDTSAPEVNTLAGYVRSPAGKLYALVGIHSNLLWNGSFAPTVYP